MRRVVGLSLLALALLLAIVLLSGLLLSVPASVLAPVAVPAVTTKQMPRSGIEPSPAQDTLPHDHPVSATLTPSADPAALPPPGTPLVTVLDELEARARRGDRRAACRLAMDGKFCRANPVDSNAVAFFEQSIARRPRTTEADIAWIARLEADHQRALKLCTGLPPRWAEESAWRWMLQAAQAGDDFLAAHFALSPPMSQSDFLERPEPWVHYRQHAAALLLAAAERGQVEAIWFLQRLHSGNTQLHGMPNAIARDPRRAAIYAVALAEVSSGASRREFAEQVRQARSAVEPAEWDAIEREGRQFAQRHFADLPPRDFQRGVMGGADSRRCD